MNAAQKQRQFGSSGVADVVQRAQMHLIENVSKPVNFERLAQDLEVGYSWFRRRFRDYTNLSPAQYFLQLKLNKAKELLSGTSFSMQQIADATGFQSPYYFSRMFKEKIGVAPTQWRNYSRGELALTTEHEDAVQTRQR